MGKLFGILGMTAVGIFFLLIGPVLTIWSWNALFGTVHTIELTWTTYFAVIGLGLFFKNVVSSSKN